MSKVQFMGGRMVPVGYVDSDYNIGFDSLSDDEIRYIIANSENPELMGKSLKKWLKKKRAKVKKVLKKWKKPLKKVGAAFLTPLNPIAAAAIGRRIKKKKLAAMTPEQRAAALKKSKKRRKIAAGIASVLIPGAAAKIGISRLAKKRIDQRKKKAAAAARKQHVSLPRAVESEVQPEDDYAKSTAVIPESARESIENGESTTVAMRQNEQSNNEETGEEPKKSTLSKVLPMAALAAIPFLLGEN